jgi:hypothetical protein
MLVSPAEREELIRRVSRQVSGGNVAATVVASAVDRVIALLTATPESPATPGRVAVVTGESMPDLASRLRAALGAAVPLGDAAVATEGRHTVLVARIKDAEVSPVRDAAERIGARLVMRDASE